MKEVLTYHRDQIDASEALSALGVQPQRYFVVSIHREENVDSKENFQEILGALNGLADSYDMPVVVSTHPRTRKRLDSLGYGDIDKRVRMLKPLGFFDYIKMQQEAYCVVSDSGTITEESNILNFPAITIRKTHERPEGMDEGVLIMSGLRSADVLRAVATVTEQAREGGERPFRLVADYDVDNFSKKVVRLVLSYTEYVNRYVWRKYA
jgi:UDP-N-acetylglucosamine 2-epimerase (non-hydrolysing)